jgi:preprotein translocase subunit SecG
MAVAAVAAVAAAVVVVVVVVERRGGSRGIGAGGREKKNHALTLWGFQGHGNCTRMTILLAWPRSSQSCAVRPKISA